MNYSIKYGETIFDVALIAYQDASRTYDLLRQNPQIQNILSDLTGITVSFIPDVVFTSPNVQKKIISTQKNVSINSGQTLFDIALQYFGDASKIIEIANGLGIDSIISECTGKTLIYTESNDAVSLYFRQTGSTIATNGIVDSINVLSTLNGLFIQTQSGQPILIT